MTPDNLPVWLLIIYLYDSWLFTYMTSDYLPVWQRLLFGLWHTPSGPCSPSIVSVYELQQMSHAETWHVCKRNQNASQWMLTLSCFGIILPNKNKLSFTPPKRKYDWNAHSYGIYLSEITWMTIQQFILRIYCTFLIKREKLVTTLSWEKHFSLILKSHYHFSDCCKLNTRKVLH